MTSWVIPTDFNASLNKGLAEGSYTGSAIPIVMGGTGATTVTTTPTASTLVGWDANKNTSYNNDIPLVTSTATTGGTTTLTVASTKIQVFTGTSGQTCTLPVVSTLTLGFQFIIVNQTAAGVMSVNSSGGGTIVSVFNGAVATCIVKLVTGTTTASWGYLTWS